MKKRDIDTISTFVSFRPPALKPVGTTGDERRNTFYTTVEYMGSDAIFRPAYATAGVDVDDDCQVADRSVHRQTRVVCSSSKFSGLIK